jgi:hypothetical protein
MLNFILIKDPAMAGYREMLKAEPSGAGWVLPRWMGEKT